MADPVQVSSSTSTTASAPPPSSSITTTTSSTATTAIQRLPSADSTSTALQGDLSNLAPQAVGVDGEPLGDPVYIKEWAEKANKLRMEFLPYYFELENRQHDFDFIERSDQLASIKTDIDASELCQERKFDKAEALIKERLTKHYAELDKAEAEKEKKKELEKEKEKEKEKERDRETDGNPDKEREPAGGLSAGSEAAAAAAAASGAHTSSSSTTIGSNSTSTIPSSSSSTVVTTESEPRRSSRPRQKTFRDGELDDSDLEGDDDDDGEEEEEDEEEDAQWHGNADEDDEMYNGSDGRRRPAKRGRGRPPKKAKKTLSIRRSRSLGVKSGLLAPASLPTGDLKPIPERKATLVDKKGEITSTAYRASATRIIERYGDRSKVRLRPPPHQPVSGTESWLPGYPLPETQALPRHLTVTGDVVLGITIYHAARKARSQEWLVLASQPLTALRDRIRCMADFTQDGSNFATSACMFIEGVFYDDCRKLDHTRYSTPIMDWYRRNPSAQTIGPKIGDLHEPTVKTMESTLFRDLVIRMNAPYLYIHQGNCEHVWSIHTIRCVAPDDEQDRSQYPIQTVNSKIRLPKCIICNIYTAKWVTKGDLLAPINPCVYCQNCYETFHYSKQGTLLKLGDYQVNPLFDD